MRKLAVLALIHAFIVVAPLAAGTVLTVERRELPDGTAEPMVVSVEDNLVAVTGDPADGRVIFRGDHQHMLIVDDEKKTYMTLDAAMIRGISTQMTAMMQQMEDAIAKLPKEQQEMARRALQQQAPPPPPATATTTTTDPEPDVRRTTQSETRHGYPCVKYEVFEDDVKVRELWVTDWSNVQGQADISEAMSTFANFADSLTSSLSGLGGEASATSIGSSIASWWDGIDGLPVVTTEFEDGTATEESVVRSIESAELDPAKVFEVPADYTQATIGDDQ